MKSMELWKLTLAWGCLGLFFGFPVLFLVMHAFYGVRDPSFAIEYRYLGEYLKTVTAIIISLAGFNTVEIFRRPPKETNHIIPMP